MGVGGLWPLLEPTSTSITLDRLEGKRLAVDISLWLHQAAKGYSSHNLDSRCPHLSLLIHRISKLLFYKIRPVFVFDGSEVPVFKKQILRNRALKRHLDDLILAKQTQKKILEQVVQEKQQGPNDDSLSCPSSETFSPKKKTRKSDEDIFILPSTSVNLSEIPEPGPSKSKFSAQIPDYLKGFESMVSGDEQMSFLQSAKEKSREARLHVEEIPLESQKFSSFQLQRLLNRNKINTQIERLKKEKQARRMHVSADRLKTVVVDSELRSHVLLRDDEIQVIEPEKVERERLVKESLTWPQFLKQMKNESSTSKQQNNAVKYSKPGILEDEDDDLQQAILASLSEQSGLTDKSLKNIPGYGFSSAGYDEINHDSWTSESDDSSIEEVSPSHVNPLNGSVEFISSDSNAEESSVEEIEDFEEKQSDYFPKNNRQTGLNSSNEDDGIYSECQELLVLLGLPYLCAPGEAEAQCVELEKLGLVDGIISDDSDVWLFGAKTVYKNMFSKSKHVQEYNYENIFSQLGIGRKEFLQLGILSGGDYTKGFDKVGVVTALELIAEFSSVDVDVGKELVNEAYTNLKRISDWLRSKKEFYESCTDATDSQLHFIENTQRIRLRRIIENNNDSETISAFPNSEIFDAYTNPKVETSDKRFKWGRVNFEDMEEFFQKKLGFTMANVKQITHGSFEKWDEFMEQTTQQYQMRITAFTRNTDNHSRGLLSTQADLLPSAKVQCALSKLKKIKSSAQNSSSNQSAEALPVLGAIRPNKKLNAVKKTKLAKSASHILPVRGSLPRKSKLTKPRKENSESESSDEE